MKRAVAGMLLVFMLHGAANAAGPDALLGEYAERERGPAVIRITKDRGTYLVSVEERGNWSPPAQFVACPDSAHAQAFGPDWKLLAPVGLCGSIRHLRLAIFKVKPGASLGERTFKTGLVFLGLGAVDLYRL